LGGAATFLATLYMCEKWSLFFDRNKQALGLDSNGKASVSSTDSSIEE
jgi:hypothetical protein